MNMWEPEELLAWFRHTELFIPSDVPNLGSFVWKGV